MPEAMHINNNVQYHAVGYDYMVYTSGDSDVTRD